MRLRKFISMILVGMVFLGGFPVSAGAEELFSCVGEETEKFDLTEQEGYTGKVDRNDFEPFSLLDDGLILENKEKNIGRRKLMNSVANGDEYESNNNINAATANLKGKVINASLHNETDVDFYQFVVPQTDVNNAVYSSLLLTNIPSDCDYDMYLVTRNPETGEMLAYPSVQVNSYSKQLLLMFADAGTYYVLIRQSDGRYNPSVNYKLYFGPTYLKGSTGWKTTGLTFNFPVRERGMGEGLLWSTTGWQIYDGLRTDDSIPAGAMVDEFDLDSEGTGTWGGFYKYLIPASNQDIKYKQVGNLFNFDMPREQYAVKQQWGINGQINYANYFVWRPRICVDYTYPMVVQNIYYAK